MRQLGRGMDCRQIADAADFCAVRARRDGGPVGLLHIDIEHLAPINDLLGHRTGDAMLRLVADRLRAGGR
jgi:diguanylate cyclase (GGDEF)-like protein